MTGSLNSFFGQGAGSNNTTANSNSFFGATTGLSNTTGSFNSFFGASAGFSNTTGRNNSFFGVSAGQNNTEGSNNSFFGESTGLRNTTGENNAFFGQTAGLNNTSGPDNSFFGQAAGASNTIGESNSFFGRTAGFTNTSGDFNSFFGRNAGVLNRTGFNNAFFGAFAGGNNDEGFSNSFFGNGAGSNNTSGANNTAIGSGAKFAEGSLLNATAIGANARVDQDSSLVLGGITGVNGGTSVNVGIGTTAPSHRLHVVGNALFTGPLSMGTGTAAAPSMTFSGDTNTGIFSSAADTLNLSTNGISRMQISSSGNVGIGTGAPSARLTVNGMGAFNAAGAARFDLLNPTTGGTSYAQHVTDSGNWQLATVGTNLTRILVNSTGNVGIGTTNPATFRLQVAGSVGPNADNSFNLGSAGLRWGAVFAANGTIQTSDARLKQTIKPLSYGLSELMRLRPVSFRWRDGADARLHLGLLAQDVEKVIPEAVVTGDNAASPLGMNYAELIPVLIKAGQEQQAQIEYQRTQIKEQQQEIESLKRRVEEYDALKALVCADRPDAEVCRSRRGTSGND